MLNWVNRALVFNPMKSFIRPIGIAVGVMRRPIMARSSLRRTSMDGANRGLKRTLSRMVPVECRSRPWRQRVVDRSVSTTRDVLKHRYEKLSIRTISSGISSSSALNYLLWKSWVDRERVSSGSGCIREVRIGPSKREVHCTNRTTYVIMYLMRIWIEQREILLTICRLFLVARWFQLKSHIYTYKTMNFKHGSLAFGEFFHIIT